MIHWPLPKLYRTWWYLIKWDVQYRYAALFGGSSSRLTHLLVAQIHACLVGLVSKLDRGRLSK